MINLGFNISLPTTEGMVNWEGVTLGAQPLTMKAAIKRTEIKPFTIFFFLV